MHEYWTWTFAVCQTRTLRAQFLIIKYFHSTNYAFLKWSGMNNTNFALYYFCIYYEHIFNVIWNPLQFLMMNEATDHKAQLCLCFTWDCHGELYLFHDHPRPPTLLQKAAENKNSLQFFLIFSYQWWYDIDPTIIPQNGILLDKFTEPNAEILTLLWW